MDHLPAGPYKWVTLLDGTQAPWYLIPFDAEGSCEGPATQAALVDDCATKRYTDVFLFSHGWNNDWSDANKLYEGWIAGFQSMMKSQNLKLGREFRPLFAGVIWPSTSLVFPWEGAPKFAGDIESPDAAVSQGLDIVRSLATAVASPDDRARLYALSQKDTLSEAEAKDLARILAPVYASRSDDLGDKATPPSPDELLQVWLRIVPLLSKGDEAGPTGDFGFADDTGATAAPAAAAFTWKDLDPRWVYRVATVYQMKDRAGVVGSRGVKGLLDAILAANPETDPASRTRVHLLGHSYGGKVMLSALCYNIQPHAPRVDSLLLLEPAVSYLCFADAADGQGHPGGYRRASERVRQPIMSTYSSSDVPLTKYFHLALRRASDLGDQKIAAVPPSRYAALGGFGPASRQGIGAVNLITAIPGSRYALTPGSLEVLGVNGSVDSSDRGIHGHGDVSNVFTYWMLYNQITEPGTP